MTVTAPVGTARRTFTALIPLRWSDLDAFGHVNHARSVTLMEEARIRLLFAIASHLPGAGGLADGAVVVRMSVAYKRPLLYTQEPARVETGVLAVNAATFLLDQAILAGGRPAVTAEVLIAPFDPATSRPRLLDPAERDFLEAWREQGD